MTLKSKIELKGSAKKGWILTVSDNYGYREDLALTHDELLMLKKILEKKERKNN